MGIDGGGTKTVCVLADSDGRVVGTGRGGPSNYQKDGVYTAKSSLRKAVREAVAEAGIRSREIAGLCAGLAGVDRREDAEIMRRALREVMPAEHMIVENDALIALVGATERRPGAIIIAGTGSIGLGVNGRGERARAGGWGHILDDEGSGYDIARKGLMAALRAYDGRGESTRIEEKVVRELYLTSIDQVIPLLYQGQLSHTQIAALLPLVLEAAEEGDPVALQLIDQAAQQLAATATAVVTKLDCLGQDFPVATAGGVFLNSPRLLERFRAHASGRMPRARVIRPAQPPEQGALLVAKAAVDGQPLFAG